MQSNSQGVTKRERLQLKSNVEPLMRLWKTTKKSLAWIYNILKNNLKNYILTIVINDQPIKYFGPRK